jgi:hypothetical protein
LNEESLHIKLDRALRIQFRNLFGESDKKVYCWRRYLSRLKEFKTISLDLFLTNLELFSEHVVVKDPSCDLSDGPAPGKRLIVAHRDFALKCLVMGLPDICSMRFKKPGRWDMHDQMGLEFELPQRLP